MTEEAVVILTINEEVQHRNAFFNVKHDTATMAFVNQFKFLLNHSVGTLQTIYAYNKSQQSKPNGSFNKYDASNLKGVIRIADVFNVSYHLASHSNSIEFSNITFIDPEDGVTYIVDAKMMFYMNKGRKSFNSIYHSTYALSYYEAFLEKSMKVYPNNSTYKFVPEVREFLFQFTDFGDNI